MIDLEATSHHSAGQSSLDRGRKGICCCVERDSEHNTHVATPVGILPGYEFGNDHQRGDGGDCSMTTCSCPKESDVMIPAAYLTTKSAPLAVMADYLQFFFRACEAGHAP